MTRRLAAGTSLRLPSVGCPETPTSSSHSCCCTRRRAAGRTERALRRRSISSFVSSLLLLAGPVHVPEGPVSDPREGLRGESTKEGALPRIPSRGSRGSRPLGLGPMDIHWLHASHAR